MKTELAPTSSDLSLLPRADLPVIWDGFAAKAEQLRTTAETLTVTTIEQKAEMELARTTRLTLKQIRVEVEKKRIELGEGHLTEIQKINGAAKKIREMIEPLEARLLTQETFAERVEADRILELTKRRNDEVRAIWPGCPGDFGRMPQTEYDALLARLRAEAAIIAEEKARAEAAEKARKEMEAQLFAQQAEAQRQAAAAEAESALRFLAERAERRRQEQELIERLAREQSEKDAARVAKEAEEKKVRDEQEAVRRAELESEIAKHKAERAIEEAKRLELEVQLANERAVKLAEERRLHALAVAPDKEQLKAFHNSIYQVPQPDLKTPEGVAILNRVQCKIAEAFLIIDVFCAE